MNGSDRRKGLTGLIVGIAMGGYGILTTDHLVTMIGLLLVVLGGLLTLMSFGAPS